MVTQVTMIPELHLGIIVLTNAYLGIKGMDRVGQYIVLRAMAKARANTMTDSIMAVIDVPRTTPDVTPFLGAYHDPWFGNGVISLKAGTGKASGMSMKAVAPDTDFNYDFQDLDFTRL